MVDKLDSTTLTQALKTLQGWKRHKSREAIQKTFTFKDFEAAFSFMNACARYAQNVNHHPEWFNVYNTVEITLNTHDIGGVSNRDIDMACAMNKLEH